MLENEPRVDDDDVWLPGESASESDELRPRVGVEGRPRGADMGRERNDVLKSGDRYEPGPGVSAEITARQCQPPVSA